MHAYHLFNNFNFFKSRNRKCPSFSLLRMLIIYFHQNFPLKLWQNEKKPRHFVDEFQPLYTNGCYNIAGRATHSNSVYVSVLQISTVLTDGVSKSLCQKFFFFSHEQPLSALGKILYFARLMDTETRPTSLKTNTIFRLFLTG